jgi:hypothetical protein
MRGPRCCRVRVDPEFEYNPGLSRVRLDCRGTIALLVSWLSRAQPTSAMVQRLTTFTLGSLRSTRHHSRAGSWGQRLVTALTHNDSMRESKGSLPGDDNRVWYDQFTSTDWVHDSIADAYRVKALRSRTDIRGRIEAFFDGTQGWILSALVGFLTAILAYIVDVSEAPVFDWKDGYCSDGFLINEKVSRLSSLFLHCAKSKGFELLISPRIKLYMRHTILHKDQEHILLDHSFT